MYGIVASYEMPPEPVYYKNNNCKNHNIIFIFQKYSCFSNPVCKQNVLRFIMGILIHQRVCYGSIIYT